MGGGVRDCDGPRESGRGKVTTRHALRAAIVPDRDHSSVSTSPPSSPGPSSPSYIFGIDGIGRMGRLQAITTFDFPVISGHGVRSQQSLIVILYTRRRPGL
jgi:hypothetical protein